MTAISNNDIAQAIYLASKEKSHAEHSLFYSKVVQFLNRKRLLSKAPDILSRLSKIINEHEGRVVAKVFSAEKINEKTNKELVFALTHRYSAKEIALIENIDEKLLGGYKIEVNDEVIDLTIKNKIGKLQEYLTKPL
ncbi:MAG: F0F1 ATP synthase subunit delta [Candidatus Paceibacterota bacterium]|jgi:F-type H+-transporting ATPase subunit delta